MGRKSCAACGAELSSSQSARCPLCGSEMDAQKKQPPDTDDYQARVRALRKQLKHLRDEGAEAV